MKRAITVPLYRLGAWRPLSDGRCENAQPIGEVRHLNWTEHACARQAGSLGMVIRSHSSRSFAVAVRPTLDSRPIAENIKTLCRHEFCTSMKSGSVLSARLMAL